MEVTPPAVPEEKAVEAPETVEAPEVVEVPEPVVDDADKAEDEEWGAASEEIFGEPKEEPEKEEAKAPVEEVIPPAEEPVVEPTPPTDEPKKEEPEAPTTPQEDLEAVAQRVMSRNSQASMEAAKIEIKAKIMPELPQLKANDGFVVKSAKDLETIENPNTPGVAFTPQEAERIFNAHIQEVRQIESQTEARATKIATVNQALMDESTLALAAFKDVFAENPDLQKSMFEAFSKTLKVSSDGFIEEAPVGLLEFYNAALSPYVKAKAAAAPAVPAAPQPVDNTKRNQDRSDIYKPSSKVLSKDDEEWAEAEREVLGVK